MGCWWGSNTHSLTFTALPSRMTVELWACQAVLGIALLVASVTRLSTTRTTSGNTCGPTRERSRTCAHTVPTARHAQISYESMYWRGIPIRLCEEPDSCWQCFIAFIVQVSWYTPLCYFSLYLFYHFIDFTQIPSLPSFNFLPCGAL